MFKKVALNHSGKFTFPAPEIVILLHQNLLHWLYGKPEISGTTDKLSTKGTEQNPTVEVCIVWAMPLLNALLQLAAKNIKNVFKAIEQLKS